MLHTAAPGSPLICHATVESLGRSRGQATQGLVKLTPAHVRLPDWFCITCGKMHAHAAPKKVVTCTSANCHNCCCSTQLMVANGVESRTKQPHPQLQLLTTPAPASASYRQSLPLCLSRTLAGRVLVGTLAGSNTDATTGERQPDLDPDLPPSCTHGTHPGPLRCGTHSPDTHSNYRHSRTGASWHHSLHALRTNASPDDQHPALANCQRWIAGPARVGELLAGAPHCHHGWHMPQLAQLTLAWLLTKTGHVTAPPLAYNKM
jgi:hypothetical protein